MSGRASFRRASCRGASCRGASFRGASFRPPPRMRARKPSPWPRHQWSTARELVTCRRSSAAHICTVGPPSAIRSAGRRSLSSAHKVRTGTTWLKNGTENASTRGGSSHSSSSRRSAHQRADQLSRAASTSLSSSDSSSGPGTIQPSSVACRVT
ncbi:pentapeptide repeat-containing protein [Streptomyces sp. TRM72054]|uniref:pentapeptide repeat-containing protein n=1 Tax=Streptomyces sp. TRM72054 TaxID=2870562 RepID=UPI0035AC1E70